MRSTVIALAAVTPAALLCIVVQAPILFGKAETPGIARFAITVPAVGSADVAFAVSVTLAGVALAVVTLADIAAAAVTSALTVSSSGDDSSSSSWAAGRSECLADCSCVRLLVA